VEPKFIGGVIQCLHSFFKFNDHVEITLETNPGTVSKEKLAEFKSAEINRISVGIQSFDEQELKFLTRIHDKETAIKTVEDVYSIGIENISLDLMFNLPGQSLAKWAKNLEEAVELPIKHLSAYSLILERGTILNKLVLDGKVEMQDDDYDADLYEYTIDMLTSTGFEQYEVSNFSLPGYECIHNLAYWTHKAYLGLGTSAHSFINGERWWNYSSLKMYIEAVKTKGNAILGREKLTRKELLEEFIMLNMRGPGLNLTLLSEYFGNEWIQKNEKYLAGLLNEGFISRKDNFIKFTKPGYTLCDEILLKFS
jgi:oxygen-independent coproporphyrinogen-3 oxidase